MQLITTQFRAMGTPCELLLYGGNAAARTVRADLERLEVKYSRYREDSYLNRINHVAAAGGRIKVDMETSHLLDYAATCFAQSGGLFDISSGVLRHIWNFRDPKLPHPRELERALEQVGWEKIGWSSPMLDFSVAGMELDLGGVVKEYAADRAAALCLEQGVQHGLINLGGDIRVVGPHPDGSPWNVAIRHPREPGQALRTVALSHGAMATSGDYERCFMLDGRRYSHVLNPRTGWPVHGLATVSVISDYCVVSGSAATIGMLQEEAGKSWLVGLGLPHIWMDMQGKIGGSLIDEIT